MRIVDQSHEILTPINEILDYPKRIERAGRVCYKSEDKITDISSDTFIKMIMKKGHLSVIEHCSITVLGVTDRGVSHELIRHRIASYSQESTRFCDYSTNGKFHGLTFCKPVYYDDNSYELDLWKVDMLTSERIYQNARGRGLAPQFARDRLPNSLKTEIVMTFNLREWLHVFSLRAVAPPVHPQIASLMSGIQEEFHKLLPCLF